MCLLSMCITVNNVAKIIGIKLSLHSMGFSLVVMLYSHLRVCVTGCQCYIKQVKENVHSKK